MGLQTSFNMLEDTVFHTSVTPAQFANMEDIVFQFLRLLRSAHTQFAKMENKDIVFQFFRLLRMLRWVDLLQCCNRVIRNQ